MLIYLLFVEVNTNLLLELLKEFNILQEKRLNLHFHMIVYMIELTLREKTHYNFTLNRSLVKASQLEFVSALHT
jgi:hypothetical protein